MKAISLEKGVSQALSKNGKYKGENTAVTYVNYKTKAYRPMKLADNTRLDFIDNVR